MIQYIKATIWSKRAGWLRWVISPLCLAGMLAFGVANSAPSDAEHVKPDPAVAHAASGVLDAGEVQELKARLKELEDATRQNYALELEGQRKKLDWWLTFIGVLAAIMAIAGGFIPYLMGRKDKEIIELDRQSIRQDKESIEQDKRNVEQDKVQVRAWLDEIERLKHKASEDFAAIHKKLEIVSGSPEAVSEDVQQTAKKTAEDETADPLLRLRAKAVEASHPENAQEAYTLWSTLAGFDAKDANAQFNAGYWAHELADRAKGDKKLRWLRLAGEKYQQALTIKSDYHEATYNWGNALTEEARALSEIDLESARMLWQHARERYQQALGIKPDCYEAANNWAVTLTDEAKALSESDIKAARVLWQQAGEKYRQALAIKPDMHEPADSWGSALLFESNVIAESDPEESKRLLEQAEQLLLQHAEAAPGVVAYNLACVHGVRGDVTNCLHWLKVSQEHGKLPSCEHVRKDKDIDSVRNDPDFIAWLQQACPPYETAAIQDNKA